MADAKVNHELGIVEKRKAAKRASKRVKATSRAKRLTRGLKKALAKAKKPLKPVVAKDWLKAGPRVR